MRSLMLAALLSVGLWADPAFALALKNIRNCYAPPFAGATRPNLKIQGGDLIFITYDIEGHLFPGDLIFYRSVGRTDFPGGDFGQLLASVAKLAGAYPRSTPIYPGHMQSTILGQELAMNPFLGNLDSDE